MTAAAIARLVAMLYAAAGRNYGEVELEVYKRALRDITDEDGALAAETIIRGVDLGRRPPSPGLVRETVQSAHQYERLAVRPAHCAPCDGTGWIEQPDRSVMACGTCRRYVDADPVRRTRLRRGPSDPIAISAAVRNVRRAGAERNAS